ncbi:MAG: HD domain-containing protein, partial [Acidimicrobiia bacterium]|nr:HD domain-containing protein [Acidimicrobiia bacterium]
MPEWARIERWQWVLSAFLPIGSAFAAFLLVQPGDDITWIVGTAVVFAIASQIQVPSAGRSQFSAGYIVVAAMPFISTHAAEGVLLPREAVAALAIGIAGSWILRTARGDDQRQVVFGAIKRMFSYAGFIGAYALVEPQLTNMAFSEWRDAVLFIAAAGAGFGIEVLSSAVLRPGIGGAAPRMFFALDTARDLSVFISLVASGALFGIAFEVIGWWALAVAALPYAFAHGAFRRYVDARQTYFQTMRSLARIPEVAGHADPGHAARTAELAVGVAAELGLRPRDVDTVEYAALLHDIGRISLNEPSVLRMGFTDSDIAKWGSEIVGETSYLAEVSEVVLRQHEPYRNPGMESNEDVPIAAKIVKVCSAYDESTHELGLSPLEAMEKL